MTKYKYKCEVCGHTEYFEAGDGNDPPDEFEAVCLGCTGTGPTGVERRFRLV